MSFQTLHIFHCVEHFFSTIFRLLCTLLQMWFVSVTGYIHIKSFVSLAAFLTAGFSNLVTVPLLYVVNAKVNRPIHKHTHPQIYSTRHALTVLAVLHNYMHNACSPSTSCGLTPFFSSLLYSSISLHFHFIMNPSYIAAFTGLSLNANKI